MTTTSPVSDAVVHPVETAARHVRTTVTVALVSALTLVVMSYGFERVPGLRGQAPEISSLSAPVQAVVAQQEARGRTCSTSPARTDAVVVERPDQPVSVLTMAAALDVTTRGSGTIRAYCL